MWHEIDNANDLASFMVAMNFFHDSCIKEINYLSGAYVGEDLSMRPVNDRRMLKVLIQRQVEENPMVEMEFEGLKCFHLFPCDDRYTCEILDSTMMFQNGFIYWCDSGDVNEIDLDEYEGTMICASSLRWRSITGCMGPEEFYISRI